MDKLNYSENGCTIGRLEGSDYGQIVIEKDKYVVTKNQPCLIAHQSINQVKIEVSPKTDKTWVTKCQ